MCSLSVFVQRPSKLSIVEPAWASVADTATTQPMSNCYPWALVSSSKNSCCRMYQHRSVGLLESLECKMSQIWDEIHK